MFEDEKTTKKSLRQNSPLAPDLIITAKLGTENGGGEAGREE